MPTKAELEVLLLETERRLDVSEAQFEAFRKRTRDKAISVAEAHEDWARDDVNEALKYLGLDPILDLIEMKLSIDVTVYAKPNHGVMDDDLKSDAARKFVKDSVGWPGELISLDNDWTDVEVLDIEVHVESVEWAE